jgi:peptide/nickel transport system permease protein
LEVALRGNLLWFCVRRLVSAVPLLLIIVALTFVLIRLAPGDPAQFLAGDAPSPEFLARIRAEHGLDRPIHEQLGIYLWRALQLDFGTSIYFQKPVLDLVLERAPATLLLTGTAMALATMFGILLGLWAAWHRGSATDSALSTLSLLGYSIPTFWLGQLLVMLFAVWLNWLPSGGMMSARARYVGIEHLFDMAKHLILPSITLMTFELGLVARFTRTAAIEALKRDYVLMAYAKGARGPRVVWHHVLPNAIVTSITVVGLEFGVLLAGAVVTETIFSWPGLGRLFYDAVFRRDFPLLSGCFIFASAAVILVNLLTDLLTRLLDPRVSR